MARGMETNDIPVSYVTACKESSSYRVGKAFAKGCNGLVSGDLEELLPGPFAAFCVTEIHPLWRKAKMAKRTWYYGDHAYFKRKVYYRFTKNAMQHDCSGEATPHRFEKLGVKIKPWSKKGSKILIAPQSDIFYALMGLNKLRWLEEVKRQIKKVSDREIIVREKASGFYAEQQFEEALLDIWAVVCFMSAAGMQAALHGVPCFATHECVSQKFGSGDLSRIENPVYPDDRERMAWVLADNQWTIPELERGLAWEKLR